MRARGGARAELVVQELVLRELVRRLLRLPKAKASAEKVCVLAPPRRTCISARTMLAALAKVPTDAARRRRAWRAAAGRALRLRPRSATACAHGTRATAAIRAASCGRTWAGRGRTRVHEHQPVRAHYPRHTVVVARARARDEADRAAAPPSRSRLMPARGTSAGHGPVERRDGLSERGVARAVAAVGKREGLAAQETRAGSCCMGWRAR
ncbi:hypothetical protein DFH11DRAFT_1624582 [Phellopilus nigrolimitatus]|nr:hypothetical protein DFH11DRAFT_1624582 [Phellopilus nigrolimitatus]